MNSVGALFITLGSIFASLNLLATSADASPITHKEITENNFA